MEKNLFLTVIKSEPVVLLNYPICFSVERQQLKLPETQ